MALQRQGVPSRLLLFPDEGHWVLKPGNSELWHQTVFDRPSRMTAPRDADRLIQTFLSEGETDLPDRAFEAVRRDIHRTHQRVVLGPWRE